VPPFRIAVERPTGRPGSGALAALLAAACARTQGPPATAAEVPTQKEPAVNEPTSSRPRRKNRLANETSPYLLQHAENPVDWHPWGPEALERARRENKPIFLSIGYSACHWCHVMERESFEDEAIAGVLNAHFIPIKVDREERPDLDEVYMTATQLLTGSGGWPMSVFLTPDLKPFYAGTYFPPEDRTGMPSFRRVLETLVEWWKTRRGELAENAEKVGAAVATAVAVAPSAGALSGALLDRAVAELRADYDPQHGGFGGAPKFPPSMSLELLLRRWSASKDPSLLSIVEHTLDAMARGGVYDHLGGGFHRYSTDARWLVPHFEKMLYDNALLARVYLAAFQATGKEAYARVVRETLDYALREMTRPEGGFFSTQDADAEGEEGKSFVWTPAEIDAVLGPEEGRLFERAYGVTPRGNFEGGRSVLHLPLSVEDLAVALDRPAPELGARLAASRSKLLAARGERARPGLDDKVLVAWNGLLLSALARAGAVLEEPRYGKAAEEAAAFLLGTMRRKDGTLLHTFRAGQAKGEGFLDDYACLAEGLLDLYEATFDPRWFAAARELAAKMVEIFGDAKDGGFFYTGGRHESLLARTKSPFDGAVPSGNSVAAHVLLRLAAFTGEADLAKKGEATLASFRAGMERTPGGHGYMLCALDLFLDPPREVAIAGAPGNAATRALLRAVRSAYDPNLVLALADPARPEAAETIPLLEGKAPIGGRPAAFVCRRFACRAPVTDPEALAKELGR
jgi:hypothetical protein